jgi:16S rRNA (guanine1516-N2)-methyltransferase
VAILSDTPGGDALVTSKVVTLADQDNESQFDYLLLMVADKLTLRDQRGRTAVDICVDFSSPESRHKLRAGAKHPLCRAVSGRTGQLPTVCDATAGLGRDAFVLATSGCRLTLIERSPIVHALLQDGLRRATLDPHIADIAQRLRLIHGDACALLPTLADEQIPDVVYLDPMYPASRKSAAVKKGMRALQTLLAAEKSDAALSAEPLLPIAIEHARRRVVVKRPTSADSIGTHPPSGNITSGKTRYDIYAGQARQRDDEQSPGV